MHLLGLIHTILGPIGKGKPRLGVGQVEYVTDQWEWSGTRREGCWAPAGHRPVGKPEDSTCER